MSTAVPTETSGAVRRLRRVLVANRGEVVIRIASTLRFLGVESASIHTNADAGAPFTRATDASHCIGDNRNYLNIAVVVDAAKRLGCDAVHPGYGFLAENADFADAVTAAGLIFVGPTGAIIRALGSKAGAKAMLLSSGSAVPVIPGFMLAPGAAPLTPQEWQTKAAAVGYPVLIKAAAGGGGKGMRVVRDPAQFLSSFDAVITEATSAFGDSTVILERYFDDVRHIEVQILGDHHGNVTHLFERECSIQRRHQKLLEECPAASLSVELRTRICDAAVKVGQSAMYRNAGTVEFIVDAVKGEFYFLEVNTRLQVEHAVTELCTGVDIVAAQLQIAQGAPLATALATAKRRSAVYGAVIPSGANAPAPVATGFAIEARVYAEDDSFGPTVGTLTALAESRAAEYHMTVAPGTEVGVHYDGLLTKVIAYSTVSRAGAIEALVAALRSTVLFGVQQTNRKTLIHLLEHELVKSGAMATNLIDKGAISADYLKASLPSRTLGAAVRCDAVAAAVALQVLELRDAAKRPAGPWRSAPANWSNTGGVDVAPRRLIPSHDQTARYSVVKPPARRPGANVAPDATQVDVTKEDGAKADVQCRIRVNVLPASSPPSHVVVHAACATTLSWLTVSHYDETSGRHILDEFAAAQITRADALAWNIDEAKEPLLEVVHVQLMESGNAFSFGVVDRHTGSVMVSRPPTGSLLPAAYLNGGGVSSAAIAASDDASAATAAPGAVPVRSPIPAKVVRVEVASGSTVNKDAAIVVLESMKMETKVTAPIAGTVDIKVKAGDMVQGSRIMFTVTPQTA